jgi:hypothetical protein
MIRNRVLQSWSGCLTSMRIPALKAFFLVMLVRLPFVLGAGESLAGTNSSAMIVVVGAPGEDAYATNFLRQGSLWATAGQQAGMRVISIGGSGEGGTNDLELIRNTLAGEPYDGLAELWLILIGHGTFDGREARFNLRGPDLLASELAAFLNPIRRPVMVINTASSSAPFLSQLSRSNRIVISATRNGNEQNFSRFGQYLAESITDPQSDLDHDGQVSLLEAFLAGSRKTQEFYQAENRLATEHSLIDDNGDGFGTPSEWFQGLRPTRRSIDSSAADGFKAHQRFLLRNPRNLLDSLEVRESRNNLEAQIEELRERKPSLDPEEYYRQLEVICLRLARLYEHPKDSQ